MFLGRGRFPRRLDAALCCGQASPKTSNTTRMRATHLGGVVFCCTGIERPLRKQSGGQGIYFLFLGACVGKEKEVQ